MSRKTIKRRKAGFGADGMLMAAATLAAAGMTTAATVTGAKQQAKATEASAKSQAEALAEQNENNNNLQKESISFTQQQNRENRDQQQDIQTTLQLLAGQENMNDRMEATKVQVKYGGRPKHRSMKRQPSYGGANGIFEVTDGGGAVPLATDNNGYGLYELYGNDHEHYHKAQGGKNKTGVGIKFANGGVVEGEGNQNTNKGELFYVTPDDAVFISKHSIKGFNPREAVMSGMHPKQAFNIQENIKDIYDIPDYGNKAKCGKRMSMKKLYGGSQILNDAANITALPLNGTSSVAAGSAYAVNSMNNNGAADNSRTRKLKNGGRPKAYNGRSYSWGDVAGATYAGIGNTVGSLMTGAANLWAGNYLSKAATKAGNIMSDAYKNLQTIDESFINRADFAAPHTMAVIRSADTNINPQLERLRRNASSEIDQVNRNTLSSAARSQRLAGINDRMYQRMSEQYAAKHNADEQIKQANAQAITATANENANRDVQANRDYTAHVLDLKKYNNDIVNQRTLGSAGALSDARLQSAEYINSGINNAVSGVANSLTATAQGYANAMNTAKQQYQTQQDALLGADGPSKRAYAQRQMRAGDYSYVIDILGSNGIKVDPKNKAQIEQAWNEYVQSVRNSYK